MTKKTPITYKDAGVDIEAGDRFVKLIRPFTRETFRPGVMGDIGGFAALFAPDISGYRRPILVAATDGVGTKLKVAFMLERYTTVGIDLVAMCVNDIVVTGALPLFFLDYLAVSHLDPERSAGIVQGIAQGCIQAGCALVGGETAEMPGFYPAGEFELAGFAVGIIDEEQIVDGSGIAPGDQVVGLASHGLHSNGYSLARHVFFEELGLAVQDLIPELGVTVGEELLRPTRIYVHTVHSLLKLVDIKGIAHITGGGLPGNVPRILPEGCKCRIRRDAWERPAVFRIIQETRVPEDDMWNTFNMGIGMVLIVPPQHVGPLMQEAARIGDPAFLIGDIVTGQGVELV
jgi:phosphoribosylformylglycinamidine cyclo-ligase